MIDFNSKNRKNIFDSAFWMSDGIYEHSPKKLNATTFYVPYRLFKQF